MKFVELLFFVGILLSCNSSRIKQNIQSDNKKPIQVLIKKGDSLRNIGKLSDAVIYYNKSYYMDSNNISLLYKISSAYSLSDNSDSAFLFLSKTINNDSSIKCFTNPDYFTLVGDKRWDSIRDVKTKLFQLTDCKVNDLCLSIKLWEIKMKDQAFYYNMKIDPKNKSKYWVIKDSINNENIQQVSNLLDSHGWPKQSTIGKEALVSIFLVMQHANLNIQKKYLPLLVEAAKENETDKKSLAYLVDKINLAEGKKQIYGTQLDFDNETKTVYFNYGTLINPHSINDRRDSMNLESMEKYLMNWNIKWTPPK